MNFPKTIREVYVEASSLLAKQGILDHHGNVELLLLHLLNCTKSELILNWNEMFPMQLQSKFLEYVNRKLEGEPLQYIIGEQEFYGSTFQVNPAVLIPRPETELLVEAIIHEGSRIFQKSNPYVVDIGTGSGAIALSIAKKYPDWNIIASDISDDALEVAKNNARKLGLHSNIEWKQGDLLAPFLKNDCKIDIMVANLPYIPEHNRSLLQVEVREYEPSHALFAGQDGLDTYRKLMSQMQELKELPKLVGFEVGIFQAETVCKWLEHLALWEDIKIIHDFAGIQRHVIAMRN